MGLAELQGATVFPGELPPPGFPWLWLKDRVCLLVSTALATEDGEEGTLPPALKRRKKRAREKSVFKF